jgi:hypothetical protein
MRASPTIPAEIKQIMLTSAKWLPTSQRQQGSKRAVAHCCQQRCEEFRREEIVPTQPAPIIVHRAVE